MSVTLTEKTSTLPDARGNGVARFQAFYEAVMKRSSQVYNDESQKSMYSDLREYLNKVQAVVDRLADQPELGEKFINLQNQFIDDIEPKLEETSQVKELRRKLLKKNTTVFTLLVNLDPSQGVGNPDFRDGSNKFTFPEKYKLSLSDEVEGINPNSILLRKLKFLREMNFKKENQAILWGVNVQASYEKIKTTNFELFEFLEESKEQSKQIKNQEELNIYKQNVEAFAKLYLNTASVVRHVLPKENKKMVKDQLLDSLDNVSLKRTFSKLKKETDAYVSTLRKEGADKEKAGKLHDKFQVALKLQHSLEGEANTLKSMQEKVNAFKAVLDNRHSVTTGGHYSLNENKNPTGKEILAQHRDSASIRFLGVVANLLTFGLLSKLVDGRASLFWSHAKTEGSKVAIRAENILLTTPAL